MTNEELFEICRELELAVTEIFSRDDDQSRVEATGNLYTDDEFDTFKDFQEAWTMIEENGLKRQYIHYCIEKEEQEAKAV